MGSIARHVPYLRRFARALTGSRTLGDTFVSETLKALIDGRARMDRAADPRVALYSAFFQVWTVISGEVASAPGIGGHVIDRRLQALVPVNRLVFLLATMEGFDVPDMAAITGMRADDIRRSVADAEAALDRQFDARVLIIEDDWFIASDLKRIVESMGHVVVGMATRRDTAIAQARILRPSLILSDVQLDRQAGGIEAVIEIQKAFAVPVVFVTGYSDRLLTGDGPEPTYVVGKPYDEEALKALISQALFFEAAAPVPLV